MCRSVNHEAADEHQNHLMGYECMELNLLTSDLICIAEEAARVAVIR